jgi:hypothetical protein
MACERCGSPLQPDDVFCGTCGLRAPGAGAGPGVADAGLAGLVASSFGPPPSPPPSTPPLRPPPAPAPPVEEVPTRAMPVQAQPAPAMFVAPDRSPWRLPLIAAFAFCLLVAGVVAVVLALRDDTSSISDPGSTLLPILDSSTTSTIVAQTTIAATTIAATTIATETSIVAETTFVPETTVVPTTQAPTTIAPVTTVPAPPTTPVPAAGAPSVQGITASEVRPDSFDSCGNPTTYPASNAIDGQLDTAWMGVGDATGATLTLTLRQPAVVTRLGMVPGYAKTDPCTSSSRFGELRRVSSVRWTFDNGSFVDQVMDTESPSMQYVTLAAGITTRTITVKITGTTKPGVTQLDNTPISEISIG